MADILVADDTRAIRRMLSILLEEEGHTVRLASDGEEALSEYSKARPDLLLLDIMMPGKNGYQVLRQIRRKDPLLPIILLSAKGSPADVSLGLDLGSDDYLPKPFDNEVLASRIRAVLRRAQGRNGPAGDGTGSASAGRFRVGKHVVDAKRLVLIDAKGRETALTARETRLLRVLTSRSGEVVSKDELLTELWGYNFTGTTRTLDQHVFVLRKKLGRDAECIETVHGTGYRHKVSLA